jgi:hypothetical protein
LNVGYCTSLVPGVLAAVDVAMVLAGLAVTVDMYYVLIVFYGTIFCTCAGCCTRGTKYQYSCTYRSINDM